MKIKRILRYLVIGIISLWIVKNIIYIFFNNRPFIFEKYKLTSQFEEAVRLKFPVDSDLDKMLNDFRKSGAICYELGCYENRKDCAILAYCDYRAGLMSLRPLDGYSIKMYVNKDRKLIELLAWKVPNLIFGTW